MSYKVKLQFFEGPLDLLLFLIKKERIDIHDIPIAGITEQYLGYLELMKLLDLDNVGEFLVMAATLMHIKSKMLLPPDEEEVIEEQGEDPREELVRRLLEYKKFKEAATDLHKLRDDSKAVFIRKGTGEKEKFLLDTEGEYFEASLFDLISAFRKVLKDIPRETFHQVMKDRFTVSGKIQEICKKLEETPKVYFLELFRAAIGKDEVVATFLAILELIKMREIMIVQKDFFGEIEIVKTPDELKTAPVVTQGEPQGEYGGPEQP